MSGGPFTFATLYMVRAQICKERKIYVIEKAFSNVRLPCGSNDADTGAVAVGFMPAFKYRQKNSLIVFERGHKAHGYVQTADVFLLICL